MRECGLLTISKYSTATLNEMCKWIDGVIWILLLLYEYEDTTQTVTDSSQSKVSPQQKKWLNPINASVPYRRKKKTKSKSYKIICYGLNKF